MVLPLAEPFDDELDGLLELGERVLDLEADVLLAACHDVAHEVLKALAALGLALALQLIVVVEEVKGVAELLFLLFREHHHVAIARRIILLWIEVVFEAG